MTAYIGYLFLAAVQIPLFYKKPKLGECRFNSRAYLLVCCIEIILLAGLRGHTIGADTKTYLNAIDYYGSLSVSELIPAGLVYPFDFEIGYFWLTKLSVLLGFGKTGFLFIVAMIIYIPLFAVTEKHSQSPYISILTYFAFGIFTYSLGIFRQMIAISILLCGWKYVRERKLLNYIPIVALAMTFHATAVIAILIYILYGINWRRVIPFLIPAQLILFVFGRSFIKIAVKIMPQYAHYLGGKFDEQGGSYLMLLMINVVLFACIFLDKKGRYHDDMTICALMLATLVQAVGYSMALFGRIVPYYSIYLIFAVPDVIYGLDKKWRGLAGAAAVLVLFLLTVNNFSGNEYVTPYYMFFQQVP